ncbi:MAG: integrase domain-containing protein SAM domain-containing protein, partial [Pseudanabaena sp.]
LRAEEVCRLNVEDYVNGELAIKEAKWDSKGEVPLTKLGIQDLDASLDWRGEQEGELLPDSALFVSCSNRSQGKRLS